jgi:septum formation protein
MSESTRLPRPVLILASASPRRAELLKAAGIEVEVRPASIDEGIDPGEAAEAYARRVASDKARAGVAASPGRAVLAADTVVVVDGEILGKPRDAADARRMLGLLSGRTHEVLTAVALVTPDGRSEAGLAVTVVEFAALSPREIDWYVATGEPADILVKVDRMSMAHSLEARVPFLDRSVVELARRMPLAMRLRGLTTKHVLRRVMAERLPGEVLRGKKRGFNVPMPTWIAGGLREFACDTLSAARLKSQGLFDPRVVGRLLEEHLTRRVDHSRPIWTLLVLAVWYEETIAGVRTPASAAAGCA